MTKRGAARKRYLRSGEVHQMEREAMVRLKKAMVKLQVTLVAIEDAEKRLEALSTAEALVGEPKPKVQVSVLWSAAALWS